MDNQEKIRKLFFDPLFANLRGPDCFPNKRPLLAHYTSVAVLEAILRNDEVWLSNPLFMNDVQEVRFGITEGAKLFVTSPEIRDACEGKDRLDILRIGFDFWYNQFTNEHMLDTYVFCFSQHAKEDRDGVLSMWRGYGGNGSGAAIVFDTAKLQATGLSPLIIANVHYGTGDERIKWLKTNLVTPFAKILKASGLPDEELGEASYYFFQRLKMFALFTKHDGFQEENEWRMVYMKDRDTDKVFEKMIGYSVGPRGVEPKLKLKIEAIPGLPKTDVSLSTIVERVILGPSISSPLAASSILKMLDALGKSDLKQRVIASTIPFRAKPLL
jgi:hypothetical protein